MRSLRMVMPDADVVLLVDQDTRDSFCDDRSFPEDLNVDIRVIPVPEEFNKKVKSRYIKLSVRDVIDGDFFYIDTDTLFARAISEPDCELGMVLDKHARFSLHPYREAMEKGAERCGYRAAFEDHHFNGGLAWCRDTARVRAFFATWKELYFATIQHSSQDQTALNETNCRMDGIVTELLASYNCQLSTTGSFIQHLQDADILHYFATGVSKGIPYDLANENILCHALEYPVHPEIMRILKAPKKAFSCVRYAGNDSVMERLMQTKSFEHFRASFDRKSIAFRCTELVLIFNMKVRRKLGKILNQLGRTGKQVKH